MPIKLTTKQKDKLIEAAQNAIVFEVEGNGPFPYDMLRYDLCWPASEGYSYLIPADGTKQDRVIQLKGLKLPTNARWASFGWRVTRLVES